MCFLIIYAHFTFTTACDFYIKIVRGDTDVIKIFSHDYYYLLQFYSHILYSRANS